ncbi:MAG: hypothetical protein HQL69_20905 [Magnetococcales bacterium]|nr:hypothetical protein [Magnetococcales bacterium]
MDNPNNNKIIDQAPNDWRIYFMAFVDLLEKLDILVLELRHLQSTCIYFLRCGEMYEALLRREEAIFSQERPVSDDPTQPNSLPYTNFLHNELALSQDHRKTAEKLAALLVSPFPGKWRELAKEFGFEEGSDEYKIFQPEPQLLDKIVDFQNRQSWTGPQKEMYQVLRTAQSVKRRIVADRLYAYLEGRDALGLGCESVSNRSHLHLSGPTFFMMRMGLLARARHYLEIIQDLQQRMAQDFESFPSENPRPRVHRRREQGAYTAYMSKRIQDLRLDMNHLMTYLGSPDGIPLYPPEPPPLVHQRWGHVPTAISRAVNLEGPMAHALGSPKQSAAQETKNNNHYARTRFEFVESGFWLLDKAQNFTINLHELGHHVIHQHFDGPLTTKKLQNQKLKDGHPFFVLMEEIDRPLALFLSSYMDGAQKNPDRLHLRHVVDTNEIASDLLAATVHGTAYAFGWIEEVLGADMELALASNEGLEHHASIELSNLTCPIMGRLRDHRHWYIRGRLLVVWLKALEKEQIIEQLNNKREREEIESLKMKWQKPALANGIAAQDFADAFKEELPTIRTLIKPGKPIDIEKLDKIAEPLELRLLHGLEEVLRHLNQAIDYHIEDPAKRKAGFWEELSNNLINKVKVSSALERAIQWRKEMNSDRYKSNDQNSFPRHSQPIPGKVRNFMARIFISLHKDRYKHLEGEPKGNDNKALHSALWHLYGISHNLEALKIQKAKRKKKHLITAELSMKR